MNPIVDHLLVIAIVLGALGFFARRIFRRGKKKCDTGCGCGTTRDNVKVR